MRNENKANSSWLGPVAAALILVGGYIGYDQWSKYHEHEQMCGRLKREFSSNTETLLNESIDRTKKAGNSSPMLGLVGSIGANQMVLNQLNTNCADWMSHDYGK